MLRNKACPFVAGLPADHVTTVLGTDVADEDEEAADQRAASAAVDGHGGGDGDADVTLRPPVSFVGEHRPSFDAQHVDGQLDPETKAGFVFCGVAPLMRTGMVRPPPVASFRVARELYVAPATQSDDAAVTAAAPRSVKTAITSVAVSAGLRCFFGRPVEAPVRRGPFGAVATVDMGAAPPSTTRDYAAAPTASSVGTAPTSAHTAGAGDGGCDAAVAAASSSAPLPAARVAIRAPRRPLGASASANAAGDAALRQAFKKPRLKPSAVLD